MTFREAIATGFSNYVNFNGRASLSAFWYWILFTVLGSVVMAAIDAVAFPSSATLSPFSDLFGLATFLPSISVSVRRLHDTDRNGWWFLLSLLPIIGIIVLIVWWIQKGTPGANQYGPPPASRTASFAA
jgi:uncharacterized membrane protein YhaH (DUF805 family)